METQTKYQPRVERATIKLWVPHNAAEVAMAYPLAGPNTYRNVGEQILQAGQKVPTGDYSASLLHASYCSDAVNEPEFEDIKGTMRNRWLWVFNINIWTDKGVYSMKDLEALGLSDETSIAQLEKMLEGGKELSWGGIRVSKDGRVAFAPKESYKLGEHTLKSFAKDGLIVAVHGEAGAENMGEVASKFGYKPRTWGIEVAERQSLVKRVSAVDDYYGWFRFDGSSWSDNYIGYASGVLN